MNKEHTTLEMDLLECFKKRNIEVEELRIIKGASVYIIKVKR